MTEAAVIQKEFELLEHRLAVEGSGNALDAIHRTVSGAAPRTTALA
jgi:hypothetical protein